jgi:hypothetical protein
MSARILALALLLPLAARAAPGRFAVVVGNNLGAPARARLAFAEKDADRFQRALRELGDFPEDNVLLLRGARARDLRDAAARIDAQVARARAAGARALLVVYYSGHAGAGGLELGPDTVSFDELRQLVARSPAETKVVIVDACEAGALTQVKGATASAAVTFPLPQDEVQGTAFIASTAVGETAQESAILGGSYFTHHFEVGLRGAADADGDGLVTLTEAFHYTKSATVVATSETLVGPQHPTYDLRMAGRSDVVLADLRRAEARLVLPPDPGALYILKGRRGLVAEVPGTPSTLSLALPAGSYAVERRAPAGRATGRVALERGETRVLPRLEPTRYELARAKGGPRPTEPFLAFGARWVGMPGGGLAPSLRAGVRHELGPVGLVVHLDYAFAQVTDRTGAAPRAYSYSRVGGGATVLYPLFWRGGFLAEGGGSLGYGYSAQSWKDGRHFEAGDVTGGAALRLSMPLWKVRLALDLDGGARRVEVDGRPEIQPAGGAAVLLLYGF